jgi:hypothetical protein
MPRKPIDYKGALIYKLVCKDLSITDLYVGHTTSFKDRKRDHKSHCINQCSRRIYKTMNNNGGWDNWEMVEIEKYPCADVNEARARERYWYEFFDAKLNTRCPTFNIERNFERKKQYAKANKDKVKEYAKTYAEANKDKIKKLRKDWLEENKDKLCEKNKEYREANKDKLNKEKKQYREANKDKLIKEKKKYREANKDKIKAYREANKDNVNEKRRARYNKVKNNE